MKRLAFPRIARRAPRFADVFNAYPHNASRWFGLLESPATAHGEYLISDAVLKVAFGQ